MCVLHGLLAVFPAPYFGVALFRTQGSKNLPIELTIILSEDASEAQAASPQEQRSAAPAATASRSVVTLLKSAVQKNVRLSRGEPAARCFRALLEARQCPSFRSLSLSQE